MSGEEFQAAFDLCYNNIASNQAPGLNVYEKSFFLTKAQDDIVLALYNGNNPLGESFEQTEELRRALAPIIVTASLPCNNDDEEEENDENDEDEGEEDSECPCTTDTDGLNANGTFSTIFQLPEDVWLITFEAVETHKGGCDGDSAELMDVLPVRQDEYNVIKRNPFRGANNRRALRLDREGNGVEIVTTKEVDYYHLRYLRRPHPIIIGDLDGYSIEGWTYDDIEDDEACELPESLHQKILDRAVLLAYQSFEHK